MSSAILYAVSFAGGDVTVRQRVFVAAMMGALLGIGFSIVAARLLSLAQWATIAVMALVLLAVAAGSAVGLGFSKNHTNRNKGSR